MKNLKLTKPIALLLSALMLTSTLATGAFAAENTDAAKENGETNGSRSIEEVLELMNTLSYSEYIALHANAKEATASVTKSALEYDAENTTSAVRVETYEGKEALYMPDTGAVSFTVDIPADGLYTIGFDYYTPDGKASDIERAFRVDGEIPFKESRYLSITKNWVLDLSEVSDEYVTDSKGNNIRYYFERDPDGNEVRPQSVLSPRWMSYELKDSTGYYGDSFKFFLTKGTHTVSFEATREPIAISEIRFKPADKIPTYEEYLAKHSDAKAVSSDAAVKIQAELMSAASTQTVYPSYDRSSAISEPQDPANIRLNTIGKTNTWQSVGDWVEYNIDGDQITETGWYSLVFRFKQSEQSDMFVSRSLTINGELPFVEAANLRFDYGDEFQTASSTNGEVNFNYYFEAGKDYTLRFEVVLGDMANVISRIDKNLQILNQIYLKIKQITGATPDTYRDYNFIELIPDELNMLVHSAEELVELSEELEAITGERGSNVAILNNIARVAKRMGLNEDEIARNLETYKTNIGTLGTWMNTARNQPLELDYIVLASPDAKLPKANAGIWGSFMYEMKQFIASFYTDYNSLGSAGGENADQISVWVTTGRDQSNIVRQMINDMFTPEYGISVELKLVAGGTLLPATLAGQGPDLAYMGGSDPINYAIRNAIQRIDTFEGETRPNGSVVESFDEVIKRFNNQATVPFTLDRGDGSEKEVYALPETQSFLMMFYRTDIFADLGIEVPTTWEELKAILPVLQSKYMQIAMPQSLAGFNLLLYQRGGELYADNGMRSNLDSNLSLDTFKELCDMFTQYEFPLTYDFANRFRTGEMPIGIIDYSMYTQLNAFATEIRGMWEMVPLPGFVTEDGTINNTSTTGVSGLVMMADADNPKAAWAYMQWITSAEAQARYGNEYTALLANGTIHLTANREAMANMNWSASELEMLSAQMDNLKATPEYPGSYIFTRYMDFAFLSAYNDKTDPVEALLKQYIYINKELTRKRKEFGLNTLEVGETLADKTEETTAD